MFDVGSLSRVERVDRVEGGWPCRGGEGEKVVVGESCSCSGDGEVVVGSCSCRVEWQNFVVTFKD